MENLDVLVLRNLRDSRAVGKRALLATVVRTGGSSPRPVGSVMTEILAVRSGALLPREMAVARARDGQVLADDPSDAQACGIP